MRTSTKIIWSAYASVALSFVWGLPGLLLGLYAQRMAKRELSAQHALQPHIRRDLRGGLVISRVGIALSAFVIAIILFKWISTLAM